MRPLIYFLYSPLFLLSNVLCALVHPGLLHNSTDFTRVATNVAAGNEPWLTGFNKLINNSHASPTYVASPQATVIRGTTGEENYNILYNDIAAAYALALRWKITSNATFAAAASSIVDGWSSTLVEINGTSDKFLASGIYGYQFANVVEILRDYTDWAGFSAATDLLLNVFYPMNLDFLTNHNGANITHYWANWDLCNMASALAIGVVADNQTIFDDAINYFYTGAGEGSIDHLVWVQYNATTSGDNDLLGQLQESGRDQGHSMLDIALVTAFAKMAESQGIALFDYEDSLILKGAEYAAKYNLGNDVPYTTYENVDVVQTVINDSSRGDIRPIWELPYNRYKSMGDRVQWTTQYADLVRNNGSGAEGGGGDYESTSGGYDQLGYGTLMYTV